MPTATAEIELFASIAPLGQAANNQELVDALARETEWYEGAVKYRTPYDIATAIFNDELVEFVNDDNIRRLPRFDLEYPGCWPVLALHSVVAAHDYGRLWRKVLTEEYGIDRPELRLAMTSMTRSEDYQNELVRQGRFASPKSKHMAGVAFDFDDSGYYVQQPDGSWVSCTDPGARQDRINAGESMRQRISRDGYLEQTFVGKYADEYDQRIMEAALDAARILHDQGLLNVVLEFPGKPYSVLHMAPNPDYFALTA